jgi:hypothetical protein
LTSTGDGIHLEITKQEVQDLPPLTSITRTRSRQTNGRRAVPKTFCRAGM